MIQTIIRVCACAVFVNVVIHSLVLCQESDTSLALKQPKFDKNNLNEKFSSDWNGYLTAKYIYGKKDKLPARLKRFSTPLLLLNLLLREQSIDAESFRLLKIHERLSSEMLNGIRIDEQGLALLSIRFRASDAASDSSFVDELSVLGVRRVHQLGGLPGRTIEVIGYVSIFQLEKIAADGRTVEISRPGSFITNGL